MVIDSLINPQTLLQPRSLAALVTLYESNYLRFRALVGDLDAVVDEQVSRRSGECELQLDLQERSRYTLTFAMTYLFAEGDAIVREPDMCIRIYTDANLAEALSVSNGCVDAMLLDQARSQFKELDRRWAINSMLNKWLDYCLEQGHRFY